MLITFVSNTIDLSLEVIEIFQHHPIPQHWTQIKPLFLYSSVEKQSSRDETKSRA